MAQDKQCQDCKFWDNAHIRSRMAHCRRYAPRIGDNNYWPSTRDDDWCGEFEFRPADCSAVIETENATD